MDYVSIKALLDAAKEDNMPVSKFVVKEQAKALGVDETTVFNKMKDAYKVMRESVDVGLKERTKLKIEQEDGAKIYKEYSDKGNCLLGDNVGLVMSRALAVSEVNASMGRIVASPTAGSCGIIPACLTSIQDICKLDDDKMVYALFTSSAIGMVIANVSSIAGATGGCQAECGAAQCMAAGAIVELLGGDNDMIENAIAIAFSNIEGLVCDPVAGLVECPCIKRNAHGAVSAILAADMALAGIKSIIPVDEVLLAVKQVGDIMDDRLKETAKGGLAATPTGKVLKHKVFG